VAKGLTGGLYPISACLVNDKAGGWLNVDGAAHISTSGGAELGCLQIATALVDDETALPAREELLVEEQQVVELEPALERQERPALELLQSVQLHPRREQRRERGEVER